MTKTKPIYLDFAAATPVDDRVLRAMQPYWQDKFYNPSAGYLAGKQTATDLNQFRQRLAVCLGSKSGEVTFTAGGSEADNLAISGVMQKYPEANLVVS